MRLNLFEITPKKSILLAIFLAFSTSYNSFAKIDYLQTASELLEDFRLFPSSTEFGYCTGGSFSLTHLNLGARATMKKTLHLEEFVDTKGAENIQFGEKGVVLALQLNTSQPVNTETSAQDLEIMCEPTPPNTYHVILDFYHGSDPYASIEYTVGGLLTEPVKVDSLTGTGRRTEDGIEATLENGQIIMKTIDPKTGNFVDTKFKIKAKFEYFGGDSPKVNFKVVAFEAVK